MLFMGINLRELASVEPITLEDLRGKKLAIDAYNMLYQFLSAIRDPKGELFRDAQGRVTSHLMGLFYRTANLLEVGIKPVFVFDGKPVDLKAGTCAGRSEIREAARQLLVEAREKGDVEAMRKYAQRATRLTGELVESAKEFVKMLGLPVVQAPHDGEAQASWMCRKGFVDVVASQDWDCLLFGAPVLVRNLTAGVRANPHRVMLEKTLGQAGITRDMLIEAAILIGTDFNAGVKGVGPKTAIKLAKEGRAGEFRGQIPDFDTIKKLFLKPKVNKRFDLKWSKVDRDTVTKFLSERGFSDGRINKTLDRIDPKQKGLGEFF